jgi:hypothetical protein
VYETQEINAHSVFDKTNSPTYFIRTAHINSPDQYGKEQVIKRLV